MSQGLKKFRKFVGTILPTQIYENPRVYPCYSLTEAVQSKLISSNTRLKKAQQEVSKLHKACCRATQVKNCRLDTGKRVHQSGRKNWYCSTIPRHREVHLSV